MKKQRPVVLFLVRFFASYFLLFAGYSIYLQNSQQKTEPFRTDGITALVAEQTTRALQFLGYQASCEQHAQELSVKILFEGVYTARVIEGCNSISIIILFLAFIIAFKGPLRNTLWFGVAGILVIYLTNVMRIAVLTILLNKYPFEQVLLHNVVFPAIIYGATFLLWLLWVHKFSDNKR